MTGYGYTVARKKTKRGDVHYTRTARGRGGQLTETIVIPKQARREFLKPENQRRYVNERTVGAGVTGALGGGLLGAALQSHNARAALVGGGLGAVGGGALHALMARRRARRRLEAANQILR